MLDAMKGRLGGGSGGAAGSSLTSALGGPNGPGPKDVGPDTGSTPAADDMALQDFLANPNPDMTDVINVLKALIRGESSEGGEMAPLAPGGATPVPPTY